jgi:hypothetical protein
MYVIIGSHFVTLEGKFLLIALVIVRITLKHFDNVIFSSAKTLSKCSKVWQQFFEWCTHRCLAFRGIWRTVTFNVILTITNAISKNLPSSGTKWLPIMTYNHPPEIMKSFDIFKWSYKKKVSNKYGTQTGFHRTSRTTNKMFSDPFFSTIIIWYTATCTRNYYFFSPIE